MKWEYRHNEFETWTVGFYDPEHCKAAWFPDSDQPTEQEAKDRCLALNEITDRMFSCVSELRRNSATLQHHAKQVIAAQVRIALGT